MPTLPEKATVGQLRRALEEFDDDLPVLIHTATSWPCWMRSVIRMQMIYQGGVQEHIRIQAPYDDDEPWPAVVVSPMRGLGGRR